MKYISIPEAEYNELIHKANLGESKEVLIRIETKRHSPACYPVIAFWDEMRVEPVFGKHDSVKRFVEMVEMKLHQNNNRWEEVKKEFDVLSKEINEKRESVEKTKTEVHKELTKIVNAPMFFRWLFGVKLKDEMWINSRQRKL